MTKSEHQDFKIEPMDINKIIPYEKNTKKHPDNQIDIIASSIDKFKFDQPIVIDENNVIIKGHGRLLGAKRLGLKSVPVIIRTDMSDAEKMASRLADNKSNESDWDFELLELEFDELKELDFDMDWLEFDKESRPTKKTINMAQYNQNYILIAFKPEIFIDISDKIDELSNIEGVQVFQGVN